MKQTLPMLVLMLGAQSCSEAHLFTQSDEQADATSALGASESEVALRTVERNLYVVAEEGGGGAVACQ